MGDIYCFGTGDADFDIQRLFPFYFMYYKFTLQIFELNHRYEEIVHFYPSLILSLKITDLDFLIDTIAPSQT